MIQMDTDTKIKDLIDNFSEYMELFKNGNPFTGPSDYFYTQKVISKTKQGKYDLVFNTEFIEWIYATLTSWGMHHMGPKGGKMADFESFKQCILHNEEKILQLKSVRMNDADIEQYLTQIKELYQSLSSIMESNSKLVATTKVMHFLLPHLVSPMDREYTMKFFGKSIPTIKSSTDLKNIQKEIEIFEFVFKKMSYISRQVDCSKYLDNKFSTTIPKVIDNAIVSYVMKHKNN